MGGWSDFKEATGINKITDEIQRIPTNYGEKWDDIYGGGVDAGKELYEDVSGVTGIEAAEKAQEEMRLAQLDELGYLKEINALPQQYKEEALTKLRNLSTPEGQQAMIDQTKSSPFYQEIMAGKKAGEEGVMRAASVTGGLRSGNVNEALYDYNAQLGNRALTQGYQQQVSGLEGLAGIRTNEQGIANTMGNMSTNAMNARMGQAQMQQQGTANMMNFGLGAGGLALDLYGML